MGKLFAEGETLSAPLSTVYLITSSSHNSQYSGYSAWQIAIPCVTLQYSSYTNQFRAFRGNRLESLMLCGKSHPELDFYPIQNRKDARVINSSVRVLTGGAKLPAADWQQPGLSGHNLSDSPDPRKISLWANICVLFVHKRTIFFYNATERSVLLWALFPLESHSQNWSSLQKAPAGSLSLAFLPQHFVYFLPSSAAPLIFAVSDSTSPG